MYHSISEDTENGANPYYRTSTSPGVFAMHMKYLNDNNYKAISLSEAVNLFSNQSISQPSCQSSNYVVITFDDGFRDFYTNFPILNQYGFTATIFLPTDFINDTHKNKFKGKDCLSWSEVCELRKKGVIFGSHTATHPQLKLLKKNEIEYELKQSKDTIEEHISEPIESFSYPYAFPEEDREFIVYLRALLEECGYKNGVSTRIGTTKNGEGKFFLQRIPVNSCDDIPLFEAKLKGAYDWLHAVQYSAKSVKIYWGFAGRAGQDGHRNKKSLRGS